MGFSSQFIKWVRLLYTNPRAWISTNKDVSEMFILQRGARQGCPLSPLLFTLAIKPLALAVRQMVTVGGICYGELSEKISLYADDALTYLDGSEQSFVSLLEVVEEFGKVSGLRVGWEKSVAFPRGPKMDYTNLSHSKLTIQPTFKYLGIYINNNLSCFQALNITPIITYMETRLRTWASLPLNLIGRVNIFKIIYLSKFLCFSGFPNLFVQKTF